MMSNKLNILRTVGIMLVLCVHAFHSFAWVLCARGRPLKPVTPLTLSLHNEAEVEIEVAKNEEKHYSDLIDLTSALGPKVTAFNRANPESSIQLLAKTEFRNPASQSHKDRIAKAMIAKAEERGELTDANGHKKTILAASSGNSGHAIAKLGSSLGYEVIIVTNTKCSQEKCENIKRSGGKLWMAEELPFLFPQDLSLVTDYMEQERVLARNYPEQYFSVNQYENFDNMMAHYEETASELWDQTHQQATHFVMAASTGGSIMGVGKFLKEKHSDIQVILSDPHKSNLAGILEKARGDTAKGDAMLRRVEQITKKEGCGIQVEGAGKSELTKIMTQGGGVLQYVDEAVTVHDFDAFDMCRKIAKKNGIMIGGSAGLNVVACKQVAERCVDAGKGNVTLTTLLCDDGNKYRSKIFNDEWMQANDPRNSQALRPKNGPSSSETGNRLDPEDWDDYRIQMHTLIDACVDRMESYRELPWQPPSTSLPQQVELETVGIDGQAGHPFEHVLEELKNTIMPSATGNTHPQFMGWVHGGGLPSSVAADLVGATMNSNCGGRNQGSNEVEVACIDWLCKTAGFSMTTDSNGSVTTPFGVITGGTSQATIYAMLAARTKQFGHSIRKSGIHGLGTVRVYVSEAAHSCITRAMECLGHGSDCVIRIPIDPVTGTMKTELLRGQLMRDKANGIIPMAIVGTAGSVTVGAYDDLNALADLASENDTWFHVDAAFGYWTRLSQDPNIRSFTDHIQRANSIALDAHKWPGVNYACGALLVQDKEHLRATMASRPAYLQSASEGLAGGDTWFTDYSLDLSRGFIALKLWTALKTAGSDAIGKVVTDHCHLAKYMGRLVEKSSVLCLAHPVISNVCCFFIEEANNEIKSAAVAELAADLQLQGKGVFSTIMLGERQCFRAAIVNHRATAADVAAAIAAVEEAAKGYLKNQKNMPADRLDYSIVSNTDSFLLVRNSTIVSAKSK